jgi:fructose-specific phosphotransferase system IIA component
MNIRKILTKDVIALELKGENKEQVIEEMIDLLCASGKVENRKAAEKAIWDREKKMSTGMQNGIAIPHGKCDCVDSLVVAVGVHQAGVDFESLDGQPAHFFIMTLSPANRTGPHIQFLAEISRQLNDASVRDRMLAATSKDDVMEILAGGH